MPVRGAAAVALATVLSLVLTGAAPPAAAGPADWPFEPRTWPPQLARGRIGLEVAPMTPELREFMKAPADRGLLVSRVEAGRPGASADLKVGDVIVAAGEEPMQRPFDLVQAVARVARGGASELRVVRAGEELTLRVEPEGEEMAWLDPDRWGEWMERGLDRGSKELRERLRELERRLEEIERRLDAGQKT